MWIFVAAVVAVAVVALVVAALMRSGGDDVSVKSYHSALGTLEHLSQPERRVRRPSDPPTSPVADPLGSVPPVPVRGNEEFPDPAEPLVFDDARPKDRHRAPPGQTAPARARRAQKIALDSMNRRPRRGAGVGLAVAAVVAFAVLAYVGSRHSHSPTRASSTSTTHARSVPATTVRHPQTKRPASRPGSTTTTTAPTQIVASTSSSTGTAATYPVAGATFTVKIAATAPCWIDVTTVSSGATLWTGTLQPGATQSVQATGATTIEFGATGASVTVDTTPVVFPTPMRTPFVATFQPASSASSPTTSAPSAG